jgi:hypothetical protein
MKRCVREVVIAVILCNDNFSLKKELMLDDVDSIIPILVSIATYQLKKRQT